MEMKWIEMRAATSSIRYRRGAQEFWKRSWGGRNWWKGLSDRTGKHCWHHLYKWVWTESICESRLELPCRKATGDTRKDCIFPAMSSDRKIILVFMRALSNIWFLILESHWMQGYQKYFFFHDTKNTIYSRIVKL
jgi:hypothetical protein